VKMLLAASAGGHLDELLGAEGGWRGHDVVFVTTGRMVAERLRERCGVPVYVVGESNRQHPLKVFRVLASCIVIVLRERPDVVISTGAAHGCLLSLLGKLMGAKVVWIDSIANVERLSLSGRIVRPFADLVISQWPEVAATYCGVEYHGALV
jgi:UDP-N-acetylglucosamine:LPS N-acetylglucosamine transferase